MARRGFISRDCLNLQLSQSQYKKFKESIKQKFEVERSWTSIKRYIKQELRFSYKKDSSRPIAWNFQEHIYLQFIFSWRMLREIRDEALLVNVDESSYNRSIKRNYSWLPEGSSNPIINDRWFGRTSIIFGLVSNGEWLWINVDETTKSSDYWLFIMLLKKFLDSLKLNNWGAFKLLVDNASIHISKESRRTWAYNGFEINTIPAYSPNLAPVELVFASIKWFIKGLSALGKIDFQNRSGKVTVMNSFAKLEKEI